MKAIKLKSLRCFAALAASVLLFTAGLVSCSDSDEPDVSNPPVITPSESEEQKSLYGTYWGSLTVAGKSYDMALVVNDKTAALYSTMMTQSYPVVKYVKNADGTYTLHCYNSGEDTTADSTHVKITFTLGENGAVTCVPLIVPMAAMAQFSACTKGNAYNGEYDQGQGGQQGQQGGKTSYPDVAQDTLYGSYWGQMMGYECCLVVKSDSVSIYSSVMGGAYPGVKFIKDEDNKWTCSCYPVADCSGEEKLKVKFDTSKTPYTAVATIIAMNSDTTEMPKGKDYNYEYGGSSGEEQNFGKSVTVNANDAASTIAGLTENTTVKVTGTLDTDLMTAICTELKNQNSKLYVFLDLSETTGLKTIAASQFYGISSLAKISLPDSLETISENAFSNTSLSTLTIPNSVKIIKEYALPHSLKELYIGTGLETFGAVFYKTGSELEAITVVEENPNFSSADGILYDKNKTKIVLYPQSSKVENYVMPDTVGTVGTDWNTNFMHKTNLKTVKLGAAANGITGTSFYGSTNITSITVSPSSSYYKVVDDIIYSKDGTEIVLVPAYKKITNFTVPSSVTKLGEASFRNHTELESIEIGEQVVYIGYACFCYTSLKEISIPDNVETIYGGTFQQCNSLEKVIFGSGIKLIKMNCFDRNYDLKEAVFKGLTEEKNKWWLSSSSTKNNKKGTVTLSTTDYAENAKTVVVKTFTRELYRYEDFDYENSGE